METNKPTIWLVSGNFGQPSEVWMYRQATQMVRVDVTVVTRDHIDPHNYPVASDRIKLMPAVQTATQVKWPLVEPLMSKFGIATRMLRNWRYGFFNGGANEVRWLLEQMKMHRPAVILAQYGTLALQLLPLAKMFEVPLVAHFHGHDLSSQLRKAIYRFQLKKRAAQFAKCVVVAEYMREELLKYGVDPGNIHKIPCGAPVVNIVPSQLVAEQPCRFLCVGRLVDKKRPDLTLRAFARAQADIPAIRLTVIGNGPMQEDCQRLAKELGIADQVDFLGVQPSDRVATELQQAGCFVQHSVTAQSGDKEGWPVSIAEAAGVGLPIISTRHASIPEQVEHGVTGLLCAEGDWRMMGEHMKQLATAPQLREKMGKASREKIAHFDSGNQIEQLEQVLIDVAYS